MTAALITLLAFIIDWIAGDPPRWPHPVRLVGRLIAWLEKAARRRAAGRPAFLGPAGLILALTVVVSTLAAVWLILSLTSWLWSVLWFLAATYLVFSALCLRDLRQQTGRVERYLRDGYLKEARLNLSLVVGRDTDSLDEDDARRATIETLAENLSDGLIAPLFYLALGGPLLAWGYKAVNTLDSMIGYKNERYLELGRFSARLDDAANYIPARLAALLLILTARLLKYDWRRARAVWARDGRLHPSPNSGQPEAAMAGALNIRLGGPSYYDGALSDKPFINQGGGQAGPEDFEAAQRLVVGASLLMLALALAVLIMFTGRWGWLL
ncbi:MAG: adenosylcobinamide-phosphate synthase CbiB [Candidatus Adiutrix sp.]|jgi:adenosylcobinamide-phosphate synthase|nr:adenosylcobinamide-phosphate synthase CbiB [Candidatus Adiutrix sp.]